VSTQTVGAVSFADRVAGLERLRANSRTALAVAGGLLSNLGHAPFFFFPAFAAGLVLLVWLWDGAFRTAQPMRAAFWRTWVFATAYFLGGLYWVGNSFTQVDGALIFMIPAVLALPAGLALFWGGAAALAMKVWSARPGRIVIFALAIMSAEWVRGHLWGGFPWDLPGYVWQAGGSLSQTASVIGVYGLSMLTVLALAAPAALAGEGPLPPRLAPTLVAALGLGLLWGAGEQRLANAPPQPGVAVVRVADPGISQQEKWRPGNQDKVLAAYLDLLDGPTPSQADIVIWPESAIPTLLLENPDMLEEIGARLGPRTLITGVTRSEPGEKQTLYFNSAVVLTGGDGAARIGQIYNKSRLVPFGEFIPLWRQIEPFAAGLKLTALQEIGSGFEVGGPPARMIVPAGPPATFLICYESIFSGFVPRGPARPDWIVNVTNDAWFGGQTGPYQHYNQARYRAIEEGLPLARAAAGGISAIIDPYGREVSKTGMGGGAAEAALPPALAPTLFARFAGGIMSIVFFMTLVIGIALNFGAQKRAGVRGNSR
jgi:apolipoprotein N-acyltransferase